jgi:DNA-binding CsgD family transcriptional regulator
VNEKLPADDVFGRDEELDVIDEFVSRGAPLPAMLIIRGDAGIGKTTLWRHALELARERSFQVLACSPAETESELAFAGLSDLLGDALDKAIGDLPEPQVHALEIALRRAEPGERPPDQFAIRSAFLGGLRRLAADGPVLVAVDDVQWLDQPSELALEFAVRRLRDEPVAFVAALRKGEAPVRALLDGGPRRRVVELPVPPLSLGAIHSLLRSRLGASVHRPVLRKIHETSGGNPFFAVELGRELLRRGQFDLAPDNPLPIPSDLDVVLRERLAGLTAGTREVLLAACALARPSLELLEGACGREDVAAALDEAVGSGVLEPDLRRIRFSHPLLASACYAQALPGQRRRIHRLLAGAAADPEERARQLALSTSGRSRGVAVALERAAARAADRGAPQTATELAELALARTPRDSPDPLVGTLLAAASYALSSGDAHRARTHLREALARTAPGARRAEVLVRLAEAEEDPKLAITSCEQALAEPHVGEALASQIHQRLARACHLAGLGGQALRHARTALRLAETTGDNDLLAAALTASGEIELFHGRIELGRTLVRRALPLEAEAYSRLRESPRLTLARVLAFRDLAYDEALQIFSELLDEAEQHGDEWARRRILWNLAALHETAGDFQESYRRAIEGLELAEIDASDVLSFLVPVATAAAHLGQHDETRAVVARGLSLAESTMTAQAFYLHHTLGVLELSLGALEAADRQLHLAASVWEAMGCPADAVAVTMCADRIEVLLALGKLDEARAELARFEKLGAAHPFPNHRALVRRSRGLVAAAAGDPPEALEAFQEALAAHRSASKPFERARTLLCFGSTLRRAKRRGQARTTLLEALAEFERLSTPLWAEKARAELARIGGRTRSGDLTETERRLAELVAEGRSNKEVAAALFVTPKTVSTQLSRIYAKLGIHSRAELVRRLIEQSKV